MRKAKECGFIFSIFVKSKIMSIALTDKTIDDKFDLESLFGAWEDSRDSDEIIKEIRESRANRKNIV